MKVIYKIAAGLASLSLLGFGLFYNPGPVWKDGSYIVYYTDVGRRMGLHSNPGVFGLIPEVVVAAGSNHEWVVAEQVWEGERRFYTMRKPVRKEFPPDPEGPFTLEEYNQKVVALKLPPFSWRDSQTK